jgi:tetratricopeptide (TPR) repeat protein
MTTWEMSYSAVARQPGACRLLTLLAFLNYEDIFLGLFISDAQSKSILSKSWSWVISEGEVDVQLLEDCFAALERYSLLQRQGDGPDYSMHRLVHAWGRDRFGDDRQDMSQFCLAASRLLEEAIANVRTSASTPQAKLRFVPHMRENFDRVRWLIMVTENNEIELLDTVECFSSFISDIRRRNEAVAMRREVLDKRQRILGDEHPDTIRAMSNLANTFRSQGQLKEAAAMRKEVLEKRRRILGDEYPDTITAMNNLANTLRSQGRLNEAAAMRREVLEKRQRILGDEHPDTTRAMNNLANTLSSQGQLNEAAAMRKEVLEKRQRILGDEHPDTTRALNNLANTLSSQGQLNEAAAMRKEVLEKRQRILGDEHPDTTRAMNSLAITTQAQKSLLLTAQNHVDDNTALLDSQKPKKRQLLMKALYKLRGGLMR